MNLRKVVAVLLLALLAVFVVMNLDKASVWVFGVRTEMPIALLVFVAGMLGLGAGLLLAFVQKSKRGRDAQSRP